MCGCWRPSGERVSLAQLAKIETTRRRVGDLSRRRSSATSRSSTACAAATWAARWKRRSSKVDEQVKLPRGYHIDWAGEYESQQRAQKRLAIVVPITILVIFIILYTMFKSFKWAALMLANVAMAPMGGLLALLLTRYALQRVVGRGISGAVRRVGADRRDHAGVHQSAARARGDVDRGRGGGGRGAAAAADHDDDAGGDAGAAAGGAVACDRVGFAAAVRDRDRGRADVRTW